jgi:prolyl 4-hydroxylase
MQPTFIHQGQVSDAVCDRLLEFYTAHPQYHRRGGVSDNHADGYSDGVRSQHKECTEVSMPWHVAPLPEYMQELSKVVDAYVNEYKWATYGAPWAAAEPVNIQHYAPHEGFHAWHCERSSATAMYAARHLVFMTYLNTVEDQGETEWWYQQLKIKPRKGLTVVWPSSWTHMHRGITSPTEHKWIITGWLSYVS